jgi:uncharacterized repeat protein (TIGR04076 family)
MGMSEDGGNMDKSTWDKLKWRLIRGHLKYSREELELFKGNPRNEAVLDKGRELQEKRIIIEVVESHGCNSRHQVGDRFIFDGAGNLLTKHNPEKICVFALNAATGLIFAASELFYAGVDPNGMKFRRSGCFDVGIQCGGWGKVVVELSVEDKA